MTAKLRGLRADRIVQLTGVVPARSWPIATADYAPALHVMAAMPSQIPPLRRAQSRRIPRCFQV